MSTYINAKYGKTKRVAGLLIIDISTPASAFIVNTMAVSGAVESAIYAGGYIFINRYSSCLAIADVDPPGSASEVDSINTQGYHHQITGMGNYVYLGAGPGGIKVIRLY